MTHQKRTGIAKIGRIFLFTFSFQSLFSRFRFTLSLTLLLILRLTFIHLAQFRQGRVERMGRGHYWLNFICLARLVAVQTA
ncbi:hypothetical protein CJF47_16390 [Aeromonas sobria]|nr:hypothetical protein CJF47_16390 [Aeromonas sobria]